jgi:hypothetical protein
LAKTHVHDYVPIGLMAVTYQEWIDRGWTPGSCHDPYPSSVTRPPAARFRRKHPAERMDFATAIELFEVHRRYTAQWLRTLPAEAFAREGIHTQRGKITLGQIVDLYASHVDHHLKFVQGKRAALKA